MERGGFSRAIQGGGTGEGFETPVQITNCTPEMNQAIISDISRFSADAVYTEHMYERTDNNDAEIWASSMNLRIETLVRRGLQVTSGERNSNARMNISSSLSSKLPNTTQLIRNQDSVPSTLPPASHNTTQLTQNQESVPSTNPTASHHTSQGATSAASRENSTQEETTVLRQEIPGLPKSIEEVIEFWRNGDSRNGYKPVRLYEDRKVRALLIPQYVFGTSWRAAGNKQKFERIQFLAQQVSKCNDNIKDLTQPGSNADWNRAVRIFKEKWGVDNSTRMTPLIKKIKDIGN